MASASVFGIATLVVDFLYDSLSTSPPLSLLLRCGAGIFVIDVHCMDSINKTKIKQYKQHIYNLILHRIPSMMSGSSKSLSSFFVARERARHSFEKKTSKRAKAHLEAALESTSTPRMSLGFTVGWSMWINCPLGSPSSRPPTMQRVYHKYASINLTTWAIFNPLHSCCGVNLLVVCVYVSACARAYMRLLPA